MDRLGATVAKLAAARAIPDFTLPGSKGDRLKDLTGFGSNPGTLRARTYIPANLPANAPLVVVLHGCTQNAAGYDLSSGWSVLADMHGFALLYPEQQRSNNANLCFNWFSLADARRGGGEALSIREMVGTLVLAHDIDGTRIFATGLSAGGAMTSIMLATYPEIFAGGAIIAGLPYGNANSVGDAFARMRGRGYDSDTQLSMLVNNASEHRGPWPRVSVWHGTADTTVDPSNAGRVVDQWRAVHDLGPTLPEQDRIDGFPRETWRDAAGQALIESYTITGMAHGTPLDISGPDACGTPGPFMLDVGISSTRHIARFFGLIAPRDASTHGESTTAKAPAKVRLRALSPVLPDPEMSPVPSPASSVQAIIEDALRSAGLMT
ncbi:MAG: PHB depolymerase family esterase [Pseudomonadota bacterium]